MSGLAGLEAAGQKEMAHRHVNDVVKLLKAASEADYVVLGGGNARLLKEASLRQRKLGDNANAFRGGLRLWSTNPTTENLLK